MVPRPHLASLVDDMRRLGSQAAVVEHRGVRRFSTSYAALAQGAEWFAAELVRRGIEPGERVVLWGQNSAAWVACFFGCVLRGVLVVPLDAAGTLAFAERVVSETSPRLIVGDELLLRTLATDMAEFDLVRLDAAMRARATKIAPSQPEGLGQDTPLQILFTSGTTGEPKGVVHTHGNLLASLTPIEREIAKYRRYERFVHPLHFLHTLPLSHVFGQFMGLWIAPVLGAVVHYESRPEPSRLLSLLKRERISVLAAVPRVLSLLRAQILAAHPSLPERLKSVQGLPIASRWWQFRSIHGQLGFRFWAIVCGGATLMPELESFWTTLGVALIQGYGMTETSALVTLNHPFKPARGTLGAPLPGRELRISDEGELQVRGSMVANMAWQNGALQRAAASAEGWLSTGDLTRRDREGRLIYLGRTGRRLVTSAGLNVYLEDVEAALAAQASINGAVALAIEGAHGPEPAAVLLAAEHHLALSAVESANATLAPHQRVVRWWLWPGLDLPRTTTGKVRRHQVESWVQQRLQGESGQGEIRSEPADLLLALIASTVGSALPMVERDPAVLDAQSLESLGLDSLGRVQLQAAIEAASGRSIDEAQMASARTVRDLRRIAGLPHTAKHAVGEGFSEGSETNVEAYPPASDLAESSPSAASSFIGTERKQTFLYLRWPWAAPVRWLRALFLEACVRPLVWLLARPRVLYAEGPDGLGDSRPMLLVANHVSTYDVPLLLYALPCRLRWQVATAAAGEMLEAWRHARGNPLGPAIFWSLTVLFNVFPLPRSHGLQHAFSHAGAALDHGLSVLVFPEGQRSHGGPMAPFRGGVGLLAQQAAVQVLPIAMRQARSNRGLRPFAATISIGAPLTIHAGEEAHAITIRIESAVRALLASSRSNPEAEHPA